MLVPALTAVTSCCQLWLLLYICWCQLWQLLEAVSSYDNSYNLSTALTALARFDSCYKQLAAIPQLHYNINID